MKIPTFEELPIRKDLPAESSWGVFGDNDAPDDIPPLAIHAVPNGEKAIEALVF